MYIPPHHAETKTAALHALIHARPLGTWITQCNGELNANHIPFLLDAERGELGTLQCHVARANPVWASCSSKESLIVFQGGEESRAMAESVRTDRANLS